MVSERGSHTGRTDSNPVRSRASGVR